MEQEKINNEKSALQQERSELDQAKKALDKEKVELKKEHEKTLNEIRSEKKNLQEAAGIAHTAEILRKMREDTRKTVKSMRENAMLKTEKTAARNEASHERK